MFVACPADVFRSAALPSEIVFEYTAAESAILARRPTRPPFQRTCWMEAAEIKVAAVNSTTRPKSKPSVAGSARRKSLTSAATTKGWLKLATASATFHNPENWKRG